MGSRRLLFVFLLLLACGASEFAAAQTVGGKEPRSCSTADSAGAPCIDKVDPPGWFVGLPSPMLLIHGIRLKGARFSVTGTGASMTQSEVMANGHYALLWLSDRGSTPASVVIHATSSAGSASVPFRIEARKTAPHAGFSAADTMYLIMTDRFADGDASNDPQPSERDQARGWHGGDFRGVAQHLDYIQQLGVTILWLTPVYNNDGSAQAYHGYSTTDFYSTDPHFGSLADLQKLSADLHQRGMKFVLDTVPNHVGANHPWADDPPMPDWFHGTRADHRIASDNFPALTDPHATGVEGRDVTEGWFANMLPDLNQENPLVRQYLIQNVVWWIEITAADGLRYDTFPYVTRSFWAALDAQLRSLYPHLTTVGEVYNGNPVITSYFAGGVSRDGIDTGLSTLFDFPTMFALRRAFSQMESNVNGGRTRGLAGVADVLGQDWLYPHPERLVTFIGNHDTTRFLSRPGVSVADLKLAFALLATLRGMPQIYSGDEVAMRGGEDPDNRRDFPGGFPGNAPSAFTAAGRTPEQAEVHDWVAQLFQFRLQHPVLATGQQQDLFDDSSAMVFVRTVNVKKGCAGSHIVENGKRFVVVVNSSDAAREVKLDLRRTALAGCSAFKGLVGTSDVVRGSGREVVLRMPAKQAEILSAE